MYKRYDVVDPPTVHELARRVNEVESAALSRAALMLTVLLKPDELAARRANPTTENLVFHIESLNLGDSPYLNGHINHDEQHTSRLEPSDDDTNADAGERRLQLTVFESPTEFPTE